MIRSAEFAENEILRLDKKKKKKKRVKIYKICNFSLFINKNVSIAIKNPAS